MPTDLKGGELGSLDMIYQCLHTDNCGYQTTGQIINTKQSEEKNTQQEEDTKQLEEKNTYQEEDTKQSEEKKNTQQKTDTLQQAKVLLPEEEDSSLQSISSEAFYIYVWVVDENKNAYTKTNYEPGFIFGGGMPSHSTLNQNGVAIVSIYKSPNDSYNYFVYGNDSKYDKTGETLTITESFSMLKVELETLESGNKSKYTLLKPGDPDYPDNPLNPGNAEENKLNLHGYVRDKNGGVKGASVIIQNPTKFPTELFSIKATTDSKGYYELIGVDQTRFGTAYLSAAKDTTPIKTITNTVDYKSTYTNLDIDKSYDFYSPDDLGGGSSDTPDIPDTPDTPEDKPGQDAPGESTEGTGSSNSGSDSRSSSKRSKSSSTKSKVPASKKKVKEEITLSTVRAGNGFWMFPGQTQEIRDIMRKGKENSLVLSVNDGTDSSDGRWVYLSQELLQVMSDEKIPRLTIRTDLPQMSISFDLAAAEEINNLYSGGILMNVTCLNSDLLSEVAKFLLGTRPLYFVQMCGLNGTPLSTLKSGNITMSIPYTIAKGERTESLCAAAILPDGRVEWITNSAYNSESKLLVFHTQQLSAFGIGVFP